MVDALAGCTLCVYTLSIAELADLAGFLAGNGRWCMLVSHAHALVLRRATLLPQHIVKESKVYMGAVRLLP